MPHSAGVEFFRTKREWSKRKDLILDTYLPQYVPKVIHSLKRGVWIVDAFAGPGRFDDGEPGSPLIIRGIVEKARNSPATFGYPITPYFVERDKDLFAKLRSCVGDLRDAQLRNCDFLTCIDELVERAASQSMFLYLDPFTVSALEWKALDRLFALLDKGHSVEVLINFNVAIFVRSGLAAFKKSAPAELDTEDATEVSNAGVENLDRVAGGDWWQKIVSSSTDFGGTCRVVTDGYCKMLRGRFKEVCFHEVRDKVRHEQPKYVLVFGSRSPVALGLMNDAMVESREDFAASSRENTLFETRPESVVPDRARLPNLIRTALAVEMSREELVVEVIRLAVGSFSRKEIRLRINEMIDDGKITSKDGSRNDKSLLRPIHGRST